MALKIRCTDCTKKISIDEAFAGGMCRCPYCKAIVAVGGGMVNGAKGARPDAPTVRSVAPGAGASAEAAIAEENIPMARPVMIQGIVTIVLLVLLMGMVAGGVALALWGGPDVPVPEPEPVVEELNPFDPGGRAATVAGMTLTAPVVYVIDIGGAMRDVLDYGVFMTIVSAQSLGADNEFAVLLTGETEGRWVQDEYAAGGAAGANAVGEAMGKLQAGFITDRDAALREAFKKDPAPKTVVFFTSEAVEDGEELAAEAKAKGIRIVAIALDSDPEARMILAKLAADTGGQSKEFSVAELEQYRDQAGDKLPKILQE